MSSNDSREDIIAWFQSTPGLIVSGVIFGGLVLSLGWNVITDIVGSLAG